MLVWRRWLASQDEISNAFPAQIECNPRNQNPDSTSGGQHHEQAKAITILQSGKTLEMNFSPLKPLVLQEDEEDEVENLEKNDQSE